jgi:hypothetical protein
MPSPPCVLRKISATSVFQDFRSQRHFSSVLHNIYTEALPFALAQTSSSIAELSHIMKVAAEVCPICEGTGWKPVSTGIDRRVTRCDCQIKERGQVLLSAARIPKRYEHCELSNFEFEGPVWQLVSSWKITRSILPACS